MEDERGVVAPPRALESQVPATVDSVRAIEQVRAQVAVAKRFPRDEGDSETRILQACKRLSLASVAIYRYQRGGAVEGPSIRLAEALANRWGNLDFGWRVVEERDGQSLLEAWCIDLETNTRNSTQWTVRHERKAAGRVHRLTESRDLYELVANEASRRMRARILAIIPKEVTDAAVAQCKRAIIEGEKGQPFEDRVKTMVRRFGELGVSREMIEMRLKHSVDLLTQEQLVEMIGIWNSLNERASKREEWFEIPPAERPRASSAELLEVDA